MSGFFEIGVVRSSLVSKRHEKAITGLREANSRPIGVKNRQPIAASRLLVGRGKCVRQYFDECWPTTPSAAVGPIAPKNFHTLILRLGGCTGIPFPIHPHMLRHGCGYALAIAGHDTQAIQAWMGHKNIQHMVRYTELSPTRCKGFWRD
jgi:site-specific recombinase XerD